MATIAETRRQTLDIGAVVRGTFAPLGRNPATFFGLSFLLAGLPRALLSWMQMGLGFGPAGAFGAAAISTPGKVLAFFVVGLGVWALGGVLQAAMIYGVVEDLNGRRPTLGACLSTGLRFALPVIAISWLFGFAVGCGLVLLIVPGLMLMTRWAVSIPAEVIERTGVFRAFARSRDLVRGSRWAIFALLVALAIAAFAVQMTFGALLGGVMMANPNPLAGIRASAPIIGALAGTFIGPVGAAGVASIYVELRTLKEGAEPASLAAVFD